MKHENDPFDLGRFVDAQRDDYATALAELRAGRKRSHWMWYVFPQIKGLGFSAMSQQYAIKSRAEAAAYLQHPLLGSRLLECTQAVLLHRGKSTTDLLGSPDDMKLKSCATLFANASGPASPYAQLLDEFFDGRQDEQTLRLFGEMKS